MPLMNKIKYIQVDNFQDYALGDGIYCIEASAGTGKTYTITRLYLRLIVEKDIGMDKILVVTFTNAATEELRSRIRQVVKIASDILSGRAQEDDIKKNADIYSYLQSIISKNSELNKKISNKLALALNEIDTAHIYTIHSFCRRMLTDFAFESGTLFGSELIEDESTYVQRVVEDFYYNVIAPIGKEFVGILVQQEENFVKSLTNLIKKLPNDPQVEVLPKVKFNPQKCKQIISELNGLIAQIKTCFEQEFESINNNFKQAVFNEVLSRNSYSENDIEEMKNIFFNLAIYNILNDEILNKVNKFSLSSLINRFKGNYKKKKKNYELHNFFSLLDKCDALVLELKKHIIAAFRKFISYHNHRYQHYRERWNVHSFKDILADMHRALQDNPDSELAKKVRSRFSAALIDEFQDTDPLQYSIFTTIFNKRGYTLYTIGDPKQAIYSFRGADVFAYIKAQSKARTIYNLKHSYRSTPALTSAINTIYGKHSNPFVFEKIQYHLVESKIASSEFDADGALYIWFVNEEDQKLPIGIARRIVANHIAAEIQNLIQRNFTIEGRPLQYSDIAVLVRKNKEATMVQEVLRKSGINSVIRSTESVFTTSEVWEFLHILEAVINPASTTDIKRALITSFYGFAAKDIIALENNNAFDAIKMQFAHYYDVWNKKGVIVMLHTLLLDTLVEQIKNKDAIVTVKEHLLQYEDGERVITNIMHCAEILATVERTKKLDPEALVEWLKKAIYAKAEVEEQQLRLESDANAVKIVTIHASKGLEYPVVFCPFLFDTSKLDDPFVFHDENDYKPEVCFKFNADNEKELIGYLFNENDKLFANIIYKEYEFKARKETLAEDIRLAYVAMTRAKYRCYVGWGVINGTNKSALSYLLHFRNGANENEAVGNFLHKGMDYNTESMLKQLEQLASECNSIKIIQIKDIIAVSHKTSALDVIQPQTIRTIEGSIQQGWQLTSYTALSYKKDDERSDEIHIPVLTQVKSNELNIFTLPAGSITGLCIHTIFEEIDFTNVTDETLPVTIQNAFKRYNIDAQWTEVVATMVRNVLSVELKESFISLMHIPHNKRRNEVEFYYPITELTSKKLIDCFNEHSLFTRQYGQALQNISFGSINGFMNGKIDMIFEHNNVYYIVDWKTNLLGTSLDDYHSSKLTPPIAQHLYFLQYTIYTVALHRYLQLVQGKSYSYDKHFGGIFYIFVRGVDAQKGNQYGIFYDKPDATFIEKISTLLHGVAV